LSLARRAGALRLATQNWLVWPSFHGLAFAATLDRLGLERWDRVAGILSFNLGIEAMQMVVVAAILPSLILMSRTSAYPIFRISGAVFAGVASVGWIVERLFDLA
jgi:hypothetical protein